MSGNLAPVLIQYELYPNDVESVRSVKKIGSAKGIYALKETKLTSEQRSWFLHVIERLQHLEFDRFISPIPSKHGNLLTVVEGKTYYLTPWVERKIPEILSDEERLIETTAALHLFTEKEQSYSDEIVQDSFMALSERWTVYEQTLKNFAAEVESKIHYSPFELSFLSEHHEILKLIGEAKDCLKDWSEISKRNEQFRVALCHGKLSPSHFIDDQLLNLEHSVLDSPVRDLAYLIRGSVMRGVSKAEDPYDWMQTYEERFPLRKEERILLAAYLMYPEPIYRSIREYRGATSGKNNLLEKLELRIHNCRELRTLAERLLYKV